MPMFLGSKYLDKRNYIANMSFQVPSQFATLQEAINHLYNKIIGPDVEIVIERGTVLSENITIDHRLKGNVTIRASVTYQWEGLLYAQGAKPPLVNAPPDISVGNEIGIGAVTLSNSGNDLTVVCATTNPTFGAQLVGNKILVRDDSGAYTDHEITAIAGNVITLDTTAPTVGGKGSCFVIAPKTEIYGNAAVGPTIAIENNPNLVQFRGFTIETGALANIGLQLVNCQVQMWNMLFTSVSNGIYADTHCLIRRSFPVCVWQPTADGIAIYNNSKLFCLFGIIGSSVGAVRIGFSSQAKLTYGGLGSIAIANAENGFSIQSNSYGDLANATAIKNGVHGISAQEGSNVIANGANVDENSDTGLYVYTKSRAEASAITSTNNTNAGVQCDQASNIFLGTPSFSGNGVDTFPPSRKNGTDNVIDSRCFHPQTLVADANDVETTGGSEETLFNYILPANTLQYAGDALEINITLEYANNVNTKQVRFKFGSAVDASPNALWVGKTAFKYRVIRKPDGSQEISIIRPSVLASGFLTESTYIITSENLATDITIELTGDGVSAGDIAKRSANIVLVPTNQVI